MCVYVFAYTPCSFNKESETDFKIILSILLSPSPGKQCSLGLFPENLLLTLLTKASWNIPQAQAGFCKKVVRFNVKEAQTTGSSHSENLGALNLKTAEDSSYSFSVGLKRRLSPPYPYLPPHPTPDIYPLPEPTVLAFGMLTCTSLLTH